MISITHGVYYLNEILKEDCKSRDFFVNMITDNHNPYILVILHFAGFMLLVGWALPTTVVVNV